MSTLTPSIERLYILIDCNRNSSEERTVPKVLGTLKEFTLDIFVERYICDYSRTQWTDLFDMIKVLNLLISD